MSYNQQISSIVSSVVQTMVGWDVTSLPEGENPRMGGDQVSFSGCVTIGGDWEGSVLLVMPQNLAHNSADTMFALDPGAASDEEIRDCVGELTNMIGGNFKSQLGGKCVLSIPSVVGGRDYSVSAPGMKPVCEQSFACQGQHFSVMVLQRS